MELTLLVEVELGCDKEDTAAMPPPCMELVGFREGMADYPYVHVCVCVCVSPSVSVCQYIPVSE